MRMPTKTKNAMDAYAQTLPASTARAQCYNIANLDLGSETIAKGLKRGHSDQDGHLRMASLMVDAGCAQETAGRKHCYGVFTFEDGSTF